jgi:hypothetical protein
MLLFSQNTESSLKMWKEWNVKRKTKDNKRRYRQRYIWKETETQKERNDEEDKRSEGKIIERERSKERVREKTVIMWP